MLGVDTNVDNEGEKEGRKTQQDGMAQEKIEGDIIKN